MNPQRLALAVQVADVVPVNVAKEELRDVMDKLGLKEGTPRTQLESRGTG